MKLFDDQKPAPPTQGYILPKWNMTGRYRATAQSYMERENIGFVENENGETYSKAQIDKAIGE